MKLLSLTFLFASCFALAAPAPRPTSIAFTQGSVTRTLAVPSTLSKSALPTYTETLNNGMRKFAIGQSWVQFNDADGIVSSDWIFPITQCPPARPNETQTVQCSVSNPGTSGTWQQMRSYTMGPPPGCVESNSGWLPATPPQGACTAVPPPPSGSLSIDYSGINKQSAEYANFLSEVARSDAEPLELVMAYKLTGDTSYCARAIPQIDTQMHDTAALEYDVFHYIDGYIASMSMAKAWCPNVTAAQNAEWARIANTEVDKIWSRGCAGWGVCDLFNNYHDTFVRATVYWALASGDAARIEFARGKLVEAIAAKNQAIPGGGSFEGTGYGYYPVILQDAALVWRDSGQGDLVASGPYFDNNAALWVHLTVPTLDMFAPIGTQSRVSLPQLFDYQRAMVLLGQYMARSAATKQAAGWWLKRIDLQQMERRQDYYANLWPYAATNTPPPLTFRAPEMGITIGRTGWTEDACWLETLAGPLNQSHAHAEQGSFSYFCNRAFLSVTNNIYSNSGTHGEAGDLSGMDKNVVRFFKGGVEQKQQLGSAAVVLSHSENPATGETHLVADLTSMYAAGSGVRSWKRQIDFVGGAVAITDSVSVDAGVSALSQVNVPSVPTYSGAVCTTSNMKLTVLSPNASIAVAALGGDFSPNVRRIDIGCAAGCKYELRPTP